MGIRNVPFGYGLVIVLVGALSCGESDSANSSDGGEGGELDARIPDLIDAGAGSRFLYQWTLTGGCLGGDDVEATAHSRFDGRMFVNAFPCEAGSGFSELLSPGDYDVQLRVIDNDVVVPLDAGPMAGPLVAISDQSGPHATVENGDVMINFTFPTATSTIEVAWVFSADMEPQTCAEAGVANVDLEYERVGGAIERELRVACADGGEISGDLPTGFYLIRATAVDGGGAPVFGQQESSVSLFVGNDAGSSMFSFLGPI